MVHAWVAVVHQKPTETSPQTSSLSKLVVGGIAGWLDNEPSRVTGRLEVRPAAELGPIIVCLDTSGQPPSSALPPHP